MRCTAIIVLIISSLSSYLHSATIQTSFEGPHNRSESSPSVGVRNSESDFYAIGSGAIRGTSNGSQSIEEAYEDLGENGKIQFHQSATDPADNEEYNAAATAYGYSRGSTFGIGQLWDISIPAKSFSSYFQYISGTGYGVFQLKYVKANYGIIAADTVDMRGVVDRWLEYSFSSEQSFDWINIEPIEGQFMPTILFDNVSFSTESVPEPSSFSLLVLFGLFTAIARNSYRNIIPLSSSLDEKNQREE